MLLKNEKSLRRLIESIVNSHYSKNRKFIREQTEEEAATAAPSDFDGDDDEVDAGTGTTKPTVTSGGPASQSQTQPQTQQPQTQPAMTAMGTMGNQPQSTSQPQLPAQNAQSKTLEIPGGQSQPKNQEQPEPKNQEQSQPDISLNYIATSSSDEIEKGANIEDRSDGGNARDVFLKKGEIFVNTYGPGLDDLEAGVNFIVNIGFIPCYSVNEFKLRDEQNEIFHQFKEEYLSLNPDQQEQIQEMFSYVFLCRHLVSALVSNEQGQDLYSADLLGNLMQEVYGDNIIQQIMSNTEQMVKQVFGSNIFTDDVIKQEMSNILEQIIYYQSPATIQFDQCIVGQNVPQPEPAAQPTPNVQQETPEIHAWYRFPQLNGGYFEMADSLLNKNKMDQIQDLSRKYKPYEKKGELYGLIENANGSVTPAAAQHDLLLDFFKGQGWSAYASNLGISDPKIEQKIGSKINSLNKTSLGQILDEFFKNRKVLVGEYYLIDNAFLSYCVLSLLEKIGINAQQNYAQAYTNFVSNRSPKIVKAKFKPDELPDDVTNAEKFISPQKQTIKQMFNSRAQKDFKNYNQKSFSSNEVTPEMQGIKQSAYNNLRRSAREKIYK